MKIKTKADLPDWATPSTYAHLNVLKDDERLNVFYEEVFSRASRVWCLNVLKHEFTGAPYPLCYDETFKSIMEDSVQQDQPQLAWEVTLHDILSASLNMVRVLSDGAQMETKYSDIDLNNELAPYNAANGLWMKVNPNARDNEIKADINRVLYEFRERHGRKEPLASETIENIVEKAIRYRCLQYLDLKIWEASNGVFIKRALLANTVFYGRDDLSERALNEQTAHYANKIMMPEFIFSLNSKVNR